MAVLKSPDIDTEDPWNALPRAPVPTNLPPCCVHTPPMRVNTHAAPAPLLSFLPPMMAELPSAAVATEDPWNAFPTPPVPTNLPPCCAHTPPMRVNTHAAPPPLLSFSPPMMAVLPSADSATEDPWNALPMAPVPTNLLPCCVHASPVRVNTHAAPAVLLSPYPPTMAVLPSAESAM